jgi:hypothetical protein
MPKPLTSADLPDDLARFAEARIAAGLAASIEDALRAGAAATATLEAQQQRRESDWLAYARKEAAEGFAALDRGEGILATVDENMAAVDELAGA